MYTCHVYRAWRNCSYTIMAKLIKLFFINNKGYKFQGFVLAKKNDNFAVSSTG